MTDGPVVGLSLSGSTSLTRRRVAGRRRARSRRLDHLPFFLILGGAAAGVGTIDLGGGYVRSGTLVLSGVLLIAAVARLVLPDRRAGMLSSRCRSLDVAIYAVLGLALLAAGLLAPAAS